MLCMINLDILASGDANQKSAGLLSDVRMRVSVYLLITFHMKS